ncbi:MAG: hypothetical protein ABF665_09250 [Gluconacetobacter sp.]
MSTRPTKRTQVSATRKVANARRVQPAQLAAAVLDDLPPEDAAGAPDFSADESICLGLTYRDRITGFTGIATGHATYLTSSPSVLLSPRVGDSGGGLDPRWFDEASLVRIPDNLR